MQGDGSSGAPEHGFEREFYVREFRGRTLALALRDASPEDVAAVAGVVETLRAGGARAVVLAADVRALATALTHRPLALATPRLEAEIWRHLVSDGCAALEVGDASFDASSYDVARRLGIFKLVRLDAEGGLGGSGAGRRSFVDLEELVGLLGTPGALGGAEPRRGLLEHVRDALQAGVPAVNLCTAAGLDAELFTYAGSGTLFTRDRYVEVRRLGVDDFDAAHDLIRRGVREGYLAPRSDRQIDEILGSAFGAFIENRHLSGIGALLEHYGGVGEIASLYTITRFLGEGVGANLVSFALECARAHGLGSVFACTTSERVGAFFERLGFARVDASTLPQEKWDDYDDERRARVGCYARSLPA